MRRRLLFASLGVAAALLVAAGLVVLGHQAGKAGPATGSRTGTLVIRTAKPPPPTPDLGPTPAPKVPTPPPPLPGPPDPTPSAGIISGRVQGPSSMEFTVRNEWIGPLVNGRALVVYAGGQRIDPGGGPAVRPAVRIYFITRDQYGHNGLESGGTYVDVSANGPLSVTGVSGQLMGLRTDSGQTVIFDLQTMTFR